MLSHSILLIPAMTIVGTKISLILEMKKLGLRELQSQGHQGQAPSLHRMASCFLESCELFTFNIEQEPIPGNHLAGKYFFKKISCHLLLFSSYFRVVGHSF